MPRLCEFDPGICLTTEEKARKNLNQGKQKKMMGFNSGFKGLSRVSMSASSVRRNAILLDIFEHTDVQTDGCGLHTTRFILPHKERLNNKHKLWI